MTNQPAVQFEQVSFAYAGGAPALSGVSLRVEPGEFLGILGPNGGGKTTLLKIMLGLLGGYSGRVTVFGESPAAARARGLVGYVPQRNAAELSFPISAAQVVEMGATVRFGATRFGGSAVRERVRRSLSLVNAEALADRPIGELSGGQVQRVFIARALALEPRILVLDEPTVGIDVPGQQQFAELLARLHKELGLTILLVSHDVRTLAGASSRCDRVACLRRSLHFHAAPHGLTPQVLAEVFQHDLASVFGEVHVDAHAAAECCGDHSHPHPHPHPHAPIGVDGARAASHAKNGGGA